MKAKPAIALWCLSFATCAAAEPAAYRQWESEAQFRSPESVLYDASQGRLYVSNLDGAPTDKDGQGFISLLGTDGRIRQLKWATGLDAPKGMARLGKRLFVADIDQLVEIDVGDGSVRRRYPAADAKFLNDVTADAAGHVYVSDMATSRIYRLADGQLSVWLDSPRLAGPNGLRVVGDTLYVASWGVMEPDFSTKVPGHVLAVSLADKTISDFGSDRPIGNLDGLESFGDGSFLATDWMAGGLMRVAADGQVTVLDRLAPGSADLGFDAAQAVAWVPMMKDGRVIAIRLAR